MLEGYNILKGIKSIQGQDKFRGQAKDFSPILRSSSVISIFLNTFLTGNISDKLFEEISSNYAFKEVIQSYSQSNILYKIHIKLLGHKNILELQKKQDNLRSDKLRKRQIAVDKFRKMFQNCFTLFKIKLDL